MANAATYRIVMSKGTTLGDAGEFKSDLTSDSFSLPNATFDTPFLVTLRATFHRDADDFKLAIRAGQSGNINGKEPFYQNTFNNADDVPVPRQLQWVVDRSAFEAGNNNQIRLTKAAGSGTVTIDDIVIWYHCKV